MTEDDIRSLFDSNEKYSISHDLIAKYITSPKKISVKKMIEQNELTAVKDYIVSISDEYSFTLNAFKYCIVNYKLKFAKLFLSVEDDINNKRNKDYQDTIESLKNLITSNEESKDNQESQDNQESKESQSNSHSVDEDILRKINNINAIVYHISTKMELIIKEQIDKLLELETKMETKLETKLNVISDKIDNLPISNIIKQLDDYSKKNNSVNIL